MTVSRSVKIYRGIPYAKAGRFEYPVMCPFSPEDLKEDGPFGAACPQTRAYYEHLEVPERLFYHNEFRKGITFTYDENCLNLNIYAPAPEKSDRLSTDFNEKYPVIVFIHGGGFNSGASAEDPFDGSAYAKRGVILVTVNYRVGVLGYLTHEDIAKAHGYDGNFGLRDQITAIQWVKKNISCFHGDPKNITLMGQSAGAISIQYMLLSETCKGLFQKVIMMSGAGKFPDFALPRKAEDTHAYWKRFMEIAGCQTLSELKALPLPELFTAVEKIKSERKDNTYCTMPVIDGVLLTDSVKELIKRPMQVPTIIGFTNNDMYAILMALIGMKYGKENHAYVYYFDIDAPGDKNAAFHSSDLRYVFGTLNCSWRPYTEADRAVSREMIDRFSAFAKNGDPNLPGKAPWTALGKRVLHVKPRGTRPGHPGYLKLLWNTLRKGDPK